MAKLFLLSRRTWVALCFFCVIFFPCFSCGQQPVQLTITQAWELAKKNYPLIKQYELVARTRDYSVANASKGYLPAFTINGQATYQSDVTNLPFKIPISGFSLPTYSRDQYKIYAEADQVIYDGGAIKSQKESAAVNATIQQQNLEVELYSLYDRISQLYFGSLLVDEQLQQNDLLKKDVQNGLDKVQAQVGNGTAYRSSADELSAQLLQADQSRIELQSVRKAYLAMLGYFVHLSLSENTVLEKPQAPDFTDNINRPELLLYDFQKQNYDLQDKLLKVQLRPKFSFFVQGGYGRPGLNFLNNNFQWYYIGGIRMTWNLGKLVHLKKSKTIVNHKPRIAGHRKRNFSV